jgi:hypothetical protein
VAVSACASREPASALGDPTGGPEEPGTRGSAAPCTAGALRTCGVELGRHDGVADCAPGVQLCAAGAWSACTVDPRAAVERVALARPTALSIAGGASAACASNPCDPYCRAYADAPDGGVTGDGGTVALDATTGGSLASSNVPPGFQKKGQLDDQCNSPCTTQSCLEACQFDTHCRDNTGNANGNDECTPFDATETEGCAKLGGGVDITVPTTCELPSGARAVTVCNRGDRTAAAGVRCYVFPGNSPQFPNASPGGGTLVLTTTSALAPGQCATHQVPDSAFGSNGTRSLVCNPLPTTIAECNPHNNWSATKGHPGDACKPLTAGGGGSFAVTRLFQATCPLGTLPHWRALGWTATTPPGTSIELRLRTFEPPGYEGTCVQLEPVTSGAPAPAFVIGAGDPASCAIQGGGAGCPKNLATTLSRENLPCLQMDAHGVPSGASSPSLVDWTATYDCLPEL